MAYYNTTPQRLVNHEDDAEHERIWQDYISKTVRSLIAMDRDPPTYDHDEYEKRAREYYDYFFRTLLKTYTYAELCAPLSKHPPGPIIMPPPPHPPAYHLDDEKPPTIQDRPTLPKPPAFSRPAYAYVSAGESSLDDEKPPMHDHPTLPKPPMFSRPAYLSGGELSLDDEKPPMQDHPTLPKPPQFSRPAYLSGGKIVTGR